MELMAMLPLAVGTAVRETPAAAQSEETAGARLEISLCSHRSGAQVRSSFSIALLPLVHWHLVSVTPQLDLGRAATKQGIAHSGIPEGSWAPTKATEATTAKTVAW